MSWHVFERKKFVHSCGYLTALCWLAEWRTRFYGTADFNSGHEFEGKSVRAWKPIPASEIKHGGRNSREQVRRVEESPRCRKPTAWVKLCSGKKRSSTLYWGRNIGKDVVSVCGSLHEMSYERGNWLKLSYSMATRRSTNWRRSRPSDSEQE